MMEFVDDRTPSQKQTHCVIVLATDSFMSGWGLCRDGTSYAGWACKPEHVVAVERWVRDRREMKRVRIVGGDYRPPSISGHCHIYVAKEGHPSLRGLL
jgi:hypothetical protein